MKPAKRAPRLRWLGSAFFTAAAVAEKYFSAISAMKAKRSAVAFSEAVLMTSVFAVRASQLANCVCHAALKPSMDG